MLGNVARFICWAAFDLHLRQLLVDQHLTVLFGLALLANVDVSLGVLPPILQFNLLAFPLPMSEFQASLTIEPIELSQYPK